MAIKAAAVTKITGEGDSGAVEAVVERAREFVRTQRDWSAVARKVSEVYEEVVR